MNHVVRWCTVADRCGVRSMPMALGLLLLLCLPSIARGQGSDGTVRGTVTSRDDGSPLPYAFISIPALGIERFADDRGRFVLTKVPAGAHRLRARQLGFAQAELPITVVAGTIHEVSLALPRIMTRLAAMKVAADWECTRPGRPNAQVSGKVSASTTEPQGADAEVLFDQLEQNAARLQLLSRAYPFELQVEHRYLLQRRDGSHEIERVDTSASRSQERVAYRRGNVVFDGREDGKRVKLMRIPTLIDFAGEEFQKNHCFIVRGIEEVEGTPFVRIDFKASRRISSPDVDGTVYLDTGSYRLRRSDIRLSRVPREIRGLLGVRVTTHFADLRPGLPVVSAIHGVNSLAPVGLVNRVYATVEEQRTLQVVFLRARPDEPDSTSR